MRIDLNEAFLQAQKPPASGRRELLDAKAPGLAIRITANGVFSWTVRARLPSGKRVRPKIGEWPKLGIAAARRQARIVIGEITEGNDPTEQKRAARRAAVRSLPTVAERLVRWQAERQGKWSARYRDEVRRLAEKLILPEFGERVLAEVTREQWTTLIADVRKVTPGTASWLYSTVSSFLNHCEASGWTDANVLPRRGRARLAPAMAARERILDDAELMQIWQATVELTPKTRVFIRLLIMTAVRVGEAANIATGEIDRTAGHWRLPGTRTKNKIGLTLPLHKWLLADLATIWPVGQVGCGYRLLGAIAGSGFRGPSGLKRRVDLISGVSAWRWHDLRRTARTGMTRLGVPRDHAEAVLNHVSHRSAIEQIYDRYRFGPEIIAASLRWQTHVENLVTGKPSTELIRLPHLG